MDGRRVAWGILGAGRIGLGALAPAIRHAANASLRAVASRDPGRAAALARAAGAPVAHGSYEALLDDETVEAVYLGLPNGLHEPWAIAAARAGKHVLCDKSLALDAASAVRIADACARAGVRLMEGFMVRHHPQWEQARRLLAGGAIGQPRLLRCWLAGAAADDDHRWSPALGGGALFDVTTYGINLARLLTGEEPLAVRAEADLRGDVDQSSAVVMRFASGLLATAEGSLGSAPSQGARITGEHGELWVPEPVVTTFAPTTLVLTRAGRSETLTVPGANPFLHEIEHFSACVLDPARPLDPAEDGVANVTVCDRARRSFLEARTAGRRPLAG